MGLDRLDYTGKEALRLRLRLQILCCSGPVSAASQLPRRQRLIEPLTHEEAL